MSLIVFSTMFSSYFASITEHSFLCICKVFISKEFVRFSYGLGRFYASKRIIQSKDFDANVHAHSVSSAVQRVQCPFGRRWIMCNPFQRSNSLLGANNLFREIENYILIRYPAQTNIKRLSCNKQPQLGCVNTSRGDPLYYAFINRMYGNNTTNRMKTRKCKKLQQEKQPYKMI